MRLPRSSRKFGNPNCPMLLMDQNMFCCGRGSEKEKTLRDTKKLRTSSTSKIKVKEDFFFILEHWLQENVFYYP